MIDPIAGKTYIIKLTDGSLVPAKFEGKRVNPGYSNLYFERKATSRYRFTNLKSGREINLKSRLKIKREVE